MLQARTLCAAALLWMLTGTAASADDRYRYGDHYRSGPEVRLGIDVIWGGYGYAPRPPPVVWYPAPVYYQPYPVYDRGHGHWRGKKRHRKHHYRGRHRGWDD